MSYIYYKKYVKYKNKYTNLKKYLGGLDKYIIKKNLLEN